VKYSNYRILTAKIGRIMQLILENPYRVLGLPITASDREIAKRGDDLAMYIEMGMTKKFEHDYLFDTNAISRTKESLQRAISQLELGSQKIFHSIFWFSNANSVDQLAFELVKEGELDKAKQFWLKQTSNEVNPKNASNYRNFAIFNILQLNTNEDDYLECFIKQGKSLFQGSSPSNDDNLLQKIGGDNNRLGQSDIQLFLMEEFQKHIFSKSNGYSSEGIEKDFLDIFSDADESIRTKAIKKFTEEPIHRIEIAVEECKKKRVNDNLKAYPAADALLVSAQKQLTILEKTLSKQDIHYQFIADKVADELLACSTSYYNYTIKQDDSCKPLDIAEKISFWAKTIAVGLEIRRKIYDDLDTIADLRKQALVEPLIDEISLALTTLPIFNLITLNQIESIPITLTRFINTGLPALKSIKNINRSEYCKWSEVFINVVLNYSILYGNKANKPNYADVIKVLGNVEDLPMPSDLEKRFNENYNILRSNNEQQKPSSGGCYIATLVYGDYDSPEVLVLRRFRDNVLAKSIVGQLFIKFYYSTSPSLVKALKNRHFIQDGIRKILNAVVRRLSK
jgi:hypothetical protein